MLSIGCTLSSTENLVYSLAFPDIQDSPDQNILSLFVSANEFLDTCRQQKLSTLIHCVYGQSRSVTLCIAYLIHMGMNLEEAMTYVKNKHNAICVNPGFLSQLHLYAFRNQYSAEYSLLLSHHDQYGLHRGISEYECPLSNRRIKCKHCGNTLCMSSDIIMKRDSTTFISRYTDNFWKGFTNIRSFSTALSMNSNEFVYIFPPKWLNEMMSTFINENKSEFSIICPNCTSEVGLWRRNGLLVCDDFVAVDMFGLLKSNIRLP